MFLTTNGGGERRSARLAVLSCLALALGGCASDKYLMSQGHTLFKHRQYEQAAAAFGKDAAEPSTNQVLFLMDQGTSLFEARKYKEATEVFLKAEKLSEIKDYTSLSEEVGTLATSDNVRGYKGEDYEKVLINVYLALSYAAMGQTEDAQVEARKINQTLYKMIHEGKRNYEESPFARYLSGTFWESGKAWNDAYIDYKKTYELDPKFPGLGDDLVAMAKRMHFKEEEKEWLEKFPGAKPRTESVATDPRSGASELIAIFEKGAGPIKVPRNEDSTLPRYVARFSDTSGARLKINGEVAPAFNTGLDVAATSTRYLEDRISRMAAAKLAGVAVKGAIAAGVGKLSKNEDLGWLAFFLLLASDRADLRSWRTLPGEFQIVRVPLRPGLYDVKMEVLGWSGEVLYTLDYPQLEIMPGRKKFIIGR